MHVAARQRQRAVQQVLELAHVAREARSADSCSIACGDSTGGGDMPASCAMRASTASHIAGRSSRRSRSGGTRIWITFRR